MSSSSHRWDLPEQFCLPRGLAAVRGRVFILYHPTAPTLERASEEASAYLGLRQHFEAMGVLIWLSQPSPPPSAEVRACYAAAFCSTGPQVERVAWIVDSDRSFVASIVRSVSTQMFPRGCVVELFRDPIEGAQWMAAGVGGEFEEILEGLDTLDRNYS